jgi:hypothetical protein
MGSHAVLALSLLYREGSAGSVFFLGGTLWGETYFRFVLVSYTVWGRGLVWACRVLRLPIRAYIAILFALVLRKGVFIVRGHIGV